MPNYNIVKSACKKRLMDLGMDEGTAQVLARGRRFWLPYGDRKPIIETDWEELYNIFIVLITYEQHKIILSRHYNF